MKENVKFEKKKNLNRKWNHPFLTNIVSTLRHIPLFLYLIFINNLEIFPYILTPTQIK